MVNNEEGKGLHDRASKGKRLSEVELRQLEEWYAYQDHLELETIQMPNNDIVISDLQTQIAIALRQLVSLTDRIQRVAAKNEQLRKENTIFLKQLK